MKSLLKFITCGSVDDGKSTLIGHMLYDAKLIFTDQKKTLELDSKLGSNEGKIDYSLLLDGLIAEREQGITIDVAYRYFTTSKRSFIVADCPGHEQYTRNMAVGASFADAAVILVDAANGIVKQTKRHTQICALMGIKHIILAVNKMDLVNYDKNIFSEIAKNFQQFCAPLGINTIQIIPVSATVGDNITTKSAKTPWYNDSTLLEYLETLDIAKNSMDSSGFAMSVQRVCRPNSKFRGFQGEINSGTIKIGEKITVLPSAEDATVTKILIGNKDSEWAENGQPVTICTDKEVDISRGSVLVKNYSPNINNLLTATILWMDNNKLIVGRNYLIKCGTQTFSAHVIKIKYKIDINTGNHIKTDFIYRNELAEVDIAISEKIIFDSFTRNPVLGSFILIDRVSNMTSACGVILHDIRRGNNVVWHNTAVTREFRANQKGQKPLTIWFTGLSGSGKSTIANALEVRLTAMNKHTILLDGDNIRHGLNNDLSFTENDRIENIRRIAEVAKLMNDAGLIVLTAFISPYHEDRNNAKQIIGEDSFVEVFISTSLEECEKRDVKGLYQKARNGEIPNFTGISSPYEKPEKPALELDCASLSIDNCVNKIITALNSFNI